MEYDNFEIDIGTGDGRDFEVSVRSRAGEARELMRFPYDKLALDSRLKDLQIALLRSGGKHRRLASPQEQAVQSFGLDLFNALIANEVRVRYDVSQEMAGRDDRGLRLVLRVQQPELAALPWEFMYDPRRGEYICLSRNTPIVRYSTSPQTVQALWVKPPLHILGMAVSPTDLDLLDVNYEKQRLEQAVSELKDLVTLTWLEGQTWQDLQETMQTGPWHVFHFIGHGGFNERNDEGLITLANEAGRAFELSATNLARLLEHRHLKLVVLNSCEGARAGGVDVFSSTASILVRSGIPAVVAMQYEITDRAAIQFSRSFYKAVARGLPLEAAMVEARKAISIAVNNTVEWGTPVLYLRSSDGRLFNVRLKKEQVDSLYEEVRTAMAREDWSSAIEKITAVLEQDPSHQLAQQARRRVEEQQSMLHLYTEGLDHYNAGRLHEAHLRLERLRALDRHYKDVPELVLKIEESWKAARDLEEAQRRSQAAAQPVEEEHQRKDEDQRQQSKGETEGIRVTADRGEYKKEDRQTAEAKEEGGVDGAGGMAASSLEAPKKTERHVWDRRKVIGISVLLITSIAVAWILGSKTSKPPVEPDNTESQGLTPKSPPGMTYVEGGDFMMGRDEKAGGNELERPAHKATVKPFFIDQHEVTNEDYAEFVKATGHHRPSNWENDNYLPDAARKPVTGVTWDDATAYAKWIGKRLPTEEEWEFAARGKDGRLYPWGTAWQNGFANIHTGGLVEVGHFHGLSPYGAVDMVGNAWEWTASPVTRYADGTLLKPAADWKIMRGGSYIDSPREATTTYRAGYPARDSSDYTKIGFRCVSDLPDTAKPR